MLRKAAGRVARGFTRKPTRTRLAPNVPEQVASPRQSTSLISARTKKASKSPTMSKRHYLGAGVINMLSSVRSERAIAAAKKEKSTKQKPALCMVNRGLVAAEVMRGAKKEGRRTIWLRTPDEENAYPKAFADISLPIKDPMNPKEIMEVMDAFRKQDQHPGGYIIHLGYGFLSEKPEASQSCKEYNFMLAGPSEAAMKQFGDKRNGRITAKKYDIPVLAGYDGHGEPQTLETYLAAAKEMDFPLKPIMIKTVDGGGGTGNKLVKTVLELSENLKHFLNKGHNIILEELCEDFGYGEIQAVCDANKRVVFLGDIRETIVQVNGAKKLEEAPAQQLKGHEAFINQLKDNLSRALREADYQGAITAEFFVKWTPKGPILISCEFNTRLQVEHGVTSALYNNLFSIPELQLHIAEGGSLFKFFDNLYKKHVDASPDELHSAQSMADALRKISPIKHAIQFRIEATQLNLDDGTVRFEPVRGTIAYTLPTIDPAKGAINVGVKNGESINTYLVNPLIILVFGYGKNREDAIKNGVSILEKLNVSGVATNIEYLLAVANHPIFQAGNLTSADVKELNDYIARKPPAEPRGMGY